MRKLHPNLKAKFDALLMPEVGPQPINFSKTENLNFWVVAIASACIGIKEHGHNSGEMVELFQKTIGDSVMEPWCAAFVQSIVAYIEEKTGIKSPLYASESCLEIWHRSKDIRIERPSVGDLILWQKQDTFQGHIGVLVEIPEHPQPYQTVEGNTGNASGIQREGDGVFLRTRPRGGVGKMKELGFIRAFPFYKNTTPLKH